jgi:hypothetical protein
MSSQRVRGYALTAFSQHASENHQVTVNELQRRKVAAEEAAEWRLIETEHGHARNPSIAGIAEVHQRYLDLQNERARDPLSYLREGEIVSYDDNILPPPPPTVDLTDLLTDDESDVSTIVYDDQVMSDGE